MNLKTEVLEKWEDLQDYIQYNPIFNIYYKWFIKDFLNKDIRISEEEIQSLGDLNQNLSVKSQDLVSKLNLDKVAFLKDSGIAHISLHKESIGRIIMINNGMLGITRYKK